MKINKDNKSWFSLITNRTVTKCLDFFRYLSHHLSRHNCNDKSNNKPYLLSLSYLVFWLLLEQILFTATAWAQIIADPNSANNQRPIILETANGIPLIDIQTPSSAGVSRNNYQQFDVNTKGAILNNSRTNVQTQLGGYVQGNSHLARGTARIILNEVHSSDPSNLGGYIEIAGDKAQLVIANPAGVTCDGCGFINADRATITTGQPLINNGSLEGYRVRSGKITIAGNGMDASAVNYTDVIAHSVQVNAGIWAKNLAITTGTNDIYHGDIKANSINKANSANPTLALDVSELGGMYANHIKLVGTERGVGVNNAGVISSAGQLIITADGKLLNSGTIQSQANGQITVQSVDNSGVINSERELIVNSTQDVDNSGKINAKRIDITADTLHNLGGVIAQTGEQDLDVVSANTSNIEGQIGIAVIKEANNQEEQRQTSTDKNNQLISSAGDSSPANSYISAAKQEDAKPLAAGIIKITRTLNNDQGQIKSSSINLRTEQLVNDKGSLGLTNLEITGKDLSNQAGKLWINKQANIRADLLNNSEGLLDISGLLTFHVQDLVNQNGTFRYRNRESAVLNIKNIFNNGAGLLSSNDDLIINAGIIENTAGILIGNNNLHLKANNLTNNKGLISTNNQLQISANTIANLNSQNNNQVQQILGLYGKDITINTDNLDNAQGLLAATNKLVISSKNNLENVEGNLLAANDIAINAKQFINTNGVINTGKSLNIVADNLSGDGTISSQQDVRLDIKHDFHNSKLVVANGLTEINAAGNFDNSGAVQANTVRINSKQVNNKVTGTITGIITNIAAHDTLNNRGVIDGNSSLITANTINNVGTGRIYGDYLAIGANVLNNYEEYNAAGVIAARARLDIGAKHISNRENALIFSAGSDFNALNIGGNLDANRQAGAAADLVVNASATIESLGGLQLHSSKLRNDNLHFATEEVQVGSPKHYFQIQLKGNPNKYDRSEYSYRNHNKGSYRHNKTGASGHNWTEFRFTETHYRTKVIASDPAVIRAGSDINLLGDEFINDKSQIIAGGKLSGQLDNLHNIQKFGKYITKQVGTSQYTERKWSGGLKRKHTREYDSKKVYAPADIEESINLDVTKVIENNKQTASSFIIEERQANQTTLPAQSNIPNLIESKSSIDNEDITISTVNPIIELPSNSIFKTNPSAKGYVIETDPRFTNYRNWLNSDYMLSKLGFEPGVIHKRLGDGFYEQKLIREQISQLTGRRFLDGYADDEHQYRDLLNAGIKVAQKYQLRPGVSLTSEQMQHLTEDVVLLVNKQITFADGSTATVLVPKLYLRTKSALKVNGTGALIAANELNLNIKNDIDNSGTIIGHQTAKISTNNINNKLGRLLATDLTVNARHNINNIGGEFVADKSLRLVAGNDVNLITTTQTNTNYAGNSNFSRTNIDRIAGLYVKNTKNAVLDVKAGKDINLAAALISNNGETGTTNFHAAGNLTLEVVKESYQENNIQDRNNYLKQGYTQDIGTKIITNTDINLSSDNDFKAVAATIKSNNGTLNINADGKVDVLAGQKTTNWSEGHKKKSSNLFGSKQKISSNSLEEEQALASNLLGKNINISGNDITIAGSSIASEFDTNISSDNDLTIQYTQESSKSSQFSKVKKSGAIYSGGVALTVGKQLQSDKYQSNNTYALASIISSANGDINLRAGNRYQQTASGLAVSKGSIDIKAKQVDIDEARQISSTEQQFKFRQTGITASISTPAVAALQTGQQLHKAAQTSSSKYMQALAGATASLAAINAYEMINANPAVAGGINVSITAGSSKSDSKTVSNQDVSAGSWLAAGNNITITTTDNDINIRGSKLQAAENLVLNSARNINIKAAKNVWQSSRNSKNSSSGIGVAATAGQDGIALGVTANASAAKGNGSSKDISWLNSEVTAGKKLIINSRGDVNLVGAVAKGKQVIADIGGNLNLESLQDSSVFRSSNHNISANGTMGLGGSGNVSAGIQKISSNYQSVIEQTRISADDGFQIKVHGNTDLKGAVITSSEHAFDKNHLETGTLSATSIANKAKFKVASVGVSLAAPPTAVGAFDEISSITYSGISAGKIHITSNRAKHELSGKDINKNIAQLKRDVVTGKDYSNRLDAIFDEEQVQANFTIAETAQREVNSYLNNQAIKADKKLQTAKTTKKEANDFSNNLTPEQRQKLLIKADANETEAQVIKENWGAKGKYRQILTAVTLAAGINVSAASGQIIQNTAVNYAQQQGTGYIGELVNQGLIFEGDKNHAALHAIIGCAGAAASSQACNYGALGGLSSSLMTNLFADNPNETFAQKEHKRNLLNNLVTTAATTSAGINSSPIALNTSTTATDNNWLAVHQMWEMGNELLSVDNYRDIPDVLKKWTAISIAQDIATAKGIHSGFVDSVSDDIATISSIPGLIKDGAAETKEAVLHPIDTSKKIHGFVVDTDFKGISVKAGRAISSAFTNKLSDIGTTLWVGGIDNAYNLGNDIGSLTGHLTTGAVSGGVSTVATKSSIGLVKIGAKAASELDIKTPLKEFLIEKPSVVKTNIKTEARSSPTVTTVRTSSRQSEKDITNSLGADARKQVSYKDGKEVGYGTKGSVRPDCVKEGCSIEIKNYDIANNSRGLIRNVVKQAKKRALHLPDGMPQKVYIDVRGQAVTKKQKKFISSGIHNKSNEIIKENNIVFYTGE